MSELSSYGQLIAILDNLGFVVREFRRQRGLSLRAAAWRMGMAASTLGRIEAGESCNSENLLAILKWIDG